MTRYQIAFLLTHNTVDFKRYAGEIDLLPLIP